MTSNMNELEWLRRELISHSADEMSGRQGEKEEFFGLLDWAVEKEDLDFLRVLDLNKDSGRSLLEVAYKYLGLRVYGCGDPYHATPETIDVIGSTFASVAMVARAEHEKALRDRKNDPLCSPEEYRKFRRKEGKRHQRQLRDLFQTAYFAAASTPEDRLIIRDIIKTKGIIDEPGVREMTAAVKETHNALSSGLL